MRLVILCGHFQSAICIFVKKYLDNSIHKMHNFREHCFYKAFVNFQKSSYCTFKVQQRGDDGVTFPRLPIIGGL